MTHQVDKISSSTPKIDGFHSVQSLSQPFNNHPLLRFVPLPFSPCSSLLRCVRRRVFAPRCRTKTKRSDINNLSGKQPSQRQLAARCIKYEIQYKLFPAAANKLTLSPSPLHGPVCKHELVTPRLLTCVLE